GRERLAVHARQLALQPHLQILRRSRRPLLCGMEQARRPALAHHVHRTAPMGPRVLIIGIWYDSAATCAAPALSLGLISQASSQLSTLSDLTNLPTPSTSAQNSPSSMISSSLKCLARSV